MSNELRGYPGGWKLEDALKEHAFSLELAYWIADLLKKQGVQFASDLGAGAGFYAAFLNRQEIYTSAYDANPLKSACLSGVHIMDLSEKYDWGSNGDYWAADATLCLEVGEHIEPEYEATVLDNIANSATKKIIMSWAIPGQGGFGHVNCRENEYIIAQMQARGWKHNPEESDFLRARCSGCDWFKNTIMVFEK